MKNISVRNAIVISIGFILLMWSIKVIHNTHYIDTILEWVESIQTFTLYALAYGVFTVISVTLLLRLGKEKYRDIGFDKQNILKQLGIGLLFGVLIFLLHNLVVSTIVDALLPKAAQGIDLSTLFNTIYFLPVWIFLALFKSGFSEELWRIFTLTRFEKCFGKAGLFTALIVGSAVFGFGHLYQGVGGMIPAMVRGLLYASVYLRKRRAFEAVFAHATFDLINVTLGYVLY
ncbi:CPBP family intramembrane glutamic endopeptidase [Chloroflexota bacterium]